MGRDKPGILDSTVSSICVINQLYYSTAESLEYLLTCGADPDDPAGSSGATALHYAVTGAHVQCVHTLLHHGANVNAVTTSEVMYVLTQLDMYSYTHRHALKKRNLTRNNYEYYD